MRTAENSQGLTSVSQSYAADWTAGKMLYRPAIKVEGKKNAKGM
jgi:hypothetical protein